jgi:hypothetical protein
MGGMVGHGAVAVAADVGVIDAVGEPAAVVWVAAFRALTFSAWQAADCAETVFVKATNALAKDPCWEYTSRSAQAVARSQYGSTGVVVDLAITVVTVVVVIPFNSVTLVEFSETKVNFGFCFTAGFGVCVSVAVVVGQAPGFSVACNRPAMIVSHFARSVFI